MDTNRPRVLCVSSDRATRAAITRSLTDAPVSVVVAETSANAVWRLEQEHIDAVVLDASTVANVPGLLETVERRWPGTPAFVQWSDDGAAPSVLAEVIARTAELECSDHLSESITRLVESEVGPSFDRLVGSIRRRLADATDPGEIERAVREGFTADDRFVFAWIGEYDRGEREIVPWLTDPGAVEWPMGRTFAVGEGSQPVLERALHSRELRCVQDVAANRAVVPLGETAIDRGVEAAAIAPLATDEDRFGVLVVYARDPLPADARAAIGAVAETASRALESVAVRGRLDQREQVLERYERLVETAGDGMYVLDEEDHVTTVNDALLEMTGYSREGLLGEHVSLLFGEDGVDAATETSQALLASDESTDTVEVVLERKDGETIPCETQLAVLVHDGAYRGSVGVVRDITDRKRRERRLREQNERLEAFARIVSHDLRNPLGVAKGYLELAEEVEDPSALEKVREGLDRMETIIADVLAIARDGEGAIDPVPVELDAVVRAAWENVSTGDATLSIADSATVRADRSRLCRLLENLFRNAVEHGGSAVAVRVGRLDGSAEETVGFYVEDDGRGMPEEIRERVFESSFTTSSSGLGIGLWVVREVASAHEWSAVATESDSGGARFEFHVDADSA